MVSKKKLLGGAAIPLMASLLLNNINSYSAAPSNPISVKLTWEANPPDPTYLPGKYKIVTSKNGGPESARFVDEDSWTNGISYVPFTLEPASTYTFKVCLVARKDTNSAWASSPYIGPITYTTGAINTQDSDKPLVDVYHYNATTLENKVSLSGGISDQSHIQSFEVSGDAKGSISYNGNGGLWSSTVELKNDGLNNVILTARDYFGNETTTNLPIYKTELNASAGYDGKDFKFLLQAPADGLYSMKRSTNLIDWESIHSVPGIHGQQLELIDTNAPKDAGFYKLSFDPL